MNVRDVRDATAQMRAEVGMTLTILAGDAAAHAVDENRLEQLAVAARDRRVHVHHQPSPQVERTSVRAAE